MAFWPNSYTSKHSHWTKDGWSRDLVFQAGYATFDFRGTSGDWLKDELWILTDMVWVGTPNVEAIASLASVSNAGTAVNAGWATEYVSCAMYDSRILLRVGLAVRDTDGYIHRVAYHTTAVGQLNL